MAKRYVHGPGVDEPMVDYVGSGLSAKRYLEADHQGSIVHIADSAGATVAFNRYDEYGVPQSTNQGRFQYTGQVALTELGVACPQALHHYKARIYSPCLGRFLQVDPVGYDDQFNLYAYVGGDPVNGTDPTGTLSCEGTEETLACKVDDPGSLTPTELAHVNTQYTESVRTLMANSNEEIPLGAMVGDAAITETTTAGAVGKLLYDAHVSFSEVAIVKDKSGNLVPDEFMRATHQDGNITLYRFGVGREGNLRTDQLQGTFIHEGGHGTAAGQSLAARFPGGRIGKHTPQFRAAINAFRIRIGLPPINY